MRLVTVPCAKQGIAEVEQFVADDILQCLRDGIPYEQTFTRLIVDGQFVMSDTPMEQRTNSQFAYHAHGKVLVAGLGIGLVLTGILDKPKVLEITVVEKHQDVIDIVAPHYNHTKLKVVCGDIFTWKPEKGEYFDVIYFDIWPTICLDNLTEMATLHRRFAHYLNRGNPHRWIESWSKQELKAALRRDRKR